MSEGGDEVEAAVDSVVHDVSSVQPALIVEVALKLVINVLDNGFEAAMEETARLHGETIQAELALKVSSYDGVCNAGSSTLLTAPLVLEKATLDHVGAIPDPRGIT